MSIRREIEVTRKGLPNPIDVTYGTNILPIELEIIDFELPAGATATVYGEGTSKKTTTQNCTVSGNVISFTPKAGLFEEGKNILQIEISINGGVLYTFVQPVNCHYTIAFNSHDNESNPGTSGGNSSGTQNVVSGVTAAQATSLWTILQKAAFAKVLTAEEISAFESAWLNTNSEGNTDPDEGNTGEAEGNGTEMGSSTGITVVSWLKGVPATTMSVEFSENVEVVNNEVSLKSPVNSATFYTSSSVNVQGMVNYYDSLLGKYVKLSTGKIYYIDQEATYNHNTVATEYLSESITYNPAHEVTVKE